MAGGKARLPAPVRTDGLRVLFSKVRSSPSIFEVEAYYYPAGTLTGIAKRGMKGVETFALKTPDQLDDARAFVEKHGDPSPSLDPKDTP